ncbi:hypothetical protein PR202_ga19252 [Eleusine coracana subsp. coracana]|uniref:Uncharacterized protein n=1 Tax=Eleusine coracana subsp. coracana TaxID=191504 RepID=A0AAV5CVJ9_ELECO|nr:hypothetical protein PR202_ga19252 [Eleusine coracana subsp. coracana]
MAGSFDGRMPTRGVEQAIIAMKKGAHLLKCGKRGKPKFCTFRLSSQIVVFWGSNYSYNAFLVKVYPSHNSAKKTQGKLYGGNVDSSRALFYSRQRTMSDIDIYMEKLTSKNSNPEIHALKDSIIANKDKAHQITLTPKLKSFEGPRAACRLDSLKDVFFWGDILGNMLDHKDPSKALPKLVDSTNMIDVQSIVCGENHAAIITKKGEVYSWGNEGNGRTGRQENISASRPRIVEALASFHVKSVAYGSKHTYAVMVSGELFEWGEGAHSLGLLNDCYVRNQWLPHKLFSPMDGISVSNVACGPWHTAIITSSGQLFTYGDGTFGVLGHGDTQAIAQPKEVDSLKGLRVKCVACGPWHTAAIVEVARSFKNNNPSKLFTWGDADRGKLGHADKKAKLVPTCVDSLKDYDFVQVTCGSALTVALTINGVVYTIGNSTYGQLGNPQTDGKYVCSVQGLLKTEIVRQISSGSSHVVVLTANGKVFTWGKGTEGQLGLGDYNNRSSPTLVEALEGRHVESISCGYNFTSAVCLHKAISRNDLSVCSGCKMAFGFTRKRHNCYNCGSMFCNSCSSNKVTKAALAPDKNRRYRVCDVCFSQLQKGVDSGKVQSELKTGKGDMPRTEIARAYTPRLSRIFKDTTISSEKKVFAQGSYQRNEDSTTPIHVKSQRWGQVECPSRFISAQGSFRYQALSKNHMCGISISQRMHGPGLLKYASSLQHSCDSQREKLNMTETILVEEVNQLRSQVSLLAEQCQQRDHQIQLYKQKLDETWLIVRDEAAKCKAAKDIIKVLTNQCNALSEKLLLNQQLDNYEITPDSNQEDSQHYSNPNQKLASCKFSELINIQNHHSSNQIDKEYKAASNLAVPVDGPWSHQNGARTFASDGYITEVGSPAASVTSTSVVEQIERGVYVTFAVSPCGRKELRRVRFSRKHFGEKDAQHWWEENRCRVMENAALHNSSITS